MSTHRNWVFTLNNWTDGDLCAARGLGCSFGVIGKEVGEGGTPHLQGYVRFTNPVRLSALHTALPRAHWEPRRGTHEQARDYCRKDGDFDQWGTEPASKEEKARRSREAIAARWDAAKAGRFEELPPEHIRVYEYIHRKQLVSGDRDDLFNLWIYGPSGCGKSSMVRRHYAGFYDKRINKWWDNYDGQQVVLLDDVDPSHEFICYDLKRWSDHYAFPVEVKGGSLPPIRPSVVIVTSQFRIQDVFPKHEDAAAIHRRFLTVSWCPQTGSFTVPFTDPRGFRMEREFTPPPVPGREVPVSGEMDAEPAALTEEEVQLLSDL